MLDKAKRYFQKIQLKNKQSSIKKQFEKDGLTDEILEQQVKLNQKGHELDIPDESEFVYENYVQ